jgi:integrase-like protein
MPPPSVWSVGGELSAERGQVGDLVFFEELGFLNGAVVVAGVEAAAELAGMTNPPGRPPHPDTITRWFKRLARSAGLPHICLHGVRHSYATAGREAKIDWNALSARIGHADVAFTMKQYVQTDPATDRHRHHGADLGFRVGAGDGNRTPHDQRGRLRAQAH